MGISMPPSNYDAATDKGLMRGNNEDCFLSLPERGLWLVADGMGGHEAGEVASDIVIKTIDKNTASGNALNQAIQSAHESVLEAVKNGIGAEGMGSTVVALQSDDHDYQVSWVGDSRAYLWTHDETGGTLEQLSRDHSYVQLLLASGAIGEDEVENHPDKNVITQCIGSQDVAEVHVDSIKGQWQEKQWILLCSDGLSDELNDEQIAQVLSTVNNPKDAVAKLVKQALHKGGRDNITVQVIESPLNRPSIADRIWEWLPKIIGDRMLDGMLYGTAAVCLLLLSYWILF
jgi:protein phosphatase